MNNQIYLLYGDEDFQMEEDLAALRQRLVDPAFGELNYEVLDGPKVSSERLREILPMPPMGAGNRLVIVKDFIKGFRKGEDKDEEKDKEKDAKEKSEEERLFVTLRNLPPSVYVVFCQRGTVDRRRRLAQGLFKLAEAREYKTFAFWQDRELASWIANRARRFGAEIRPGAAELLSEIGGSNLRGLASEIKKLVTYIGERTTIDEKDVQALASRGKMEVFSLVEAFSRRDLPQALARLGQALKDKEEPLPLLHLLVRQVRLMLLIKILEEDGIRSPEETMSRLGERSLYFVRKGIDASRRYSRAELEAAFFRFHDTDIKLKTTVNSPRIWLELLLTRVMKRG